MVSVVILFSVHWVHNNSHLTFLKQFWSCYVSLLLKNLIKVPFIFFPYQNMYFLKYILFWMRFMHRYKIQKYIKGYSLRPPTFPRQAITLERFGRVGLFFPLWYLSRDVLDILSNVYLFPASDDTFHQLPSPLNHRGQFRNTCLTYLFFTYLFFHLT